VQKSGYIDKKNISELAVEIILQHGEQVYETICDLSPLKLSSIPAEIIARHARSEFKSQFRPSSKMKTSIMHHPLSKEIYPTYIINV
jgi:hypothetical protein